MMEKKLMKQRKHESGQIIVLLAVSLVVVIVVAALAVDGGMIYSERRYSQNAADASSLAGGGEILHYMEAVNEEGDIHMTKATFDCTTDLINMAKNKAILAAGVNNVDLPYLGYKIYKLDNNVWKWIETPVDGNDLEANHGVVILCNEQEKYYDTQVKVTSSISTAFAHLIYPGDLVTTNEAVVRTYPMKPYADGYAIVSTSKNCKNFADGGTYISGSAIVNIEGSGTHSNSCLIIGGTGNNLEIYTDTGLNLVYSDATISGVNTFPYNGNQEELTYDELFIPEPECPVEVRSSKNITGGTETLLPGNYPGIKITGGTVTFSPGTYCLTGDLSVDGGLILGNGVTFRMKRDLSLPNNPKDTNATITAKTTAILAAPYDPPNEPLFYMDEDNHGTIKLIGNSSSYFSGVTYAPTGYVVIGGTSDLSKPKDPVYTKDDLCKFLNIDEAKCVAVKFSAQFIGYAVSVTGDGNLDILYDPTGFVSVPGQMYLKQ